MSNTSDLAELKHFLDLAERELVCADMIDDAHRRQAELASWRDVVAGLQRRIAEAAADPFNPYGSGPEPITPRET